jgi:GH24 family phage-related lysozyme (muramidase)
MTRFALAMCLCATLYASATAAAVEKQQQKKMHVHTHFINNIVGAMSKGGKKPASTAAAPAAPAAPAMPSGNPFSNFLGGGGGGASPLGAPTSAVTPATPAGTSGGLCVPEAPFRACIRGGGGEGCIDKFKSGGGAPAAPAGFSPTTPSIGSSAAPQGSPQGCTQPAAPGFLNVGARGFNLLKAQLTEFEGRIDAVYIDSMNKPTFGIGHLIKAGDPEAGKPACPKGVCFNTQCCIQRGGTPVSASRVDSVFPRDVQIHVGEAKRIYPNFDTLPETVQLILADMCFNLGNQLADFRGMKAGIDAKDWNKAANEMINSAWYAQVGRRSKALVAKMRGLANC